MHPPGRPAGWIALGMLAFSALPAAAQTAPTKPPATTTIVNVATGTALSPEGRPLTARSDSVVLYYATGSSGTTLIATDTVTGVCTGPGGVLMASGYVTVLNGGEYPTVDLKIVVRVQYKAKKMSKYADLPGATQTIIPTAQLTPGQSARYDYTITFTPITGAKYRTVANVTITDHSGYVGTPYGPETAADFPATPYRACAGSPVLTPDPVADWPEPGLVVRLASGRLEALSGEVVPLTATIENGAATPVARPVAHILLPQGLAYVPGSATGADSVATSANVIHVYLPGQLEPGASTSFRFRVSVVDAGAATHEIRLTANAANGDAASDVATAAVRVQRNRAAETRTVIGRVWIDRNGNGRQDQAEPGVAGVEVWTADGSVATTDSTGKFSFPELRLGSHALRIDPASVSPEYGIPASTRSGVSAQVTGWTSPHVLLPLMERTAHVQELQVAARPLFLDPAFCSRAGGELGQSDSTVPGGCGPMQVASRGVPPGAPTPEIDVTLTPFPGSDEVSYRVRDGWELVEDGLDARDPARARPHTVRDRLGRDWVVSRVDPRIGSATLRLRPTGSGTGQPVRVAPARAPLTPEERAQRAIVSGPDVQIFAPVDGRVFGTDRIYVGVRGEPGAVVTLFDGPREIAREAVRIDGQLDFVSVHVAAGPHILRARMTNSWDSEQWDSVHVHVSGVPATLQPEHEALSLPADPKHTTRVRVRVLDRWAVPVVNQPYVTLRAEQAHLAGPDADASSVGLQVRTDTLGWVEVLFTPEREIGTGTITLVAGEAQATIALDLFAPVRPLIVIGNAQFGVGATNRSEGALTVRGHLDQRTAITASLDSRGRDPSNPRFGGEIDPMREGVLPIIGDAGEQHSVASYDSHLSLRVERGHQYVAFGDIKINRTLDGLSLLRHERSVRGLTARVEAGGVEWSGFGALTTQAFRQVQVRGAGTSGPYALGGRVLMGTEQVNIEVRDLLNAQHVLSRQHLTPYIDYEIDYESGTLLLKQPLPATDLNGNPVFLMISYEGQGAGPRGGVWGLHARRNLFGDSSFAGLTYVRDDQVALGGLQLFGTDLHLALGRAGAVRSEVVYASRPDSSDFALGIEGKVSPWGDRLTLSAAWSRTGPEFRNPADLSLVPGTSDLRLGATTRFGTGRLRLEHSAQRFTTQHTSRERTVMGMTQPLWAGLELETTVTDDRSVGGGSANQRSGLADTKLSWRASDRVRVWGEARRQLWSYGPQIWGNHIGGGASLRVLRDLELEARHLRVTASDSIHYSLTSLGARSSLAQGTRAWGSYEITGGLSGASNAAIVGLNNRLPLGEAWSLTTLIERRQGVQRAAAGDPVRAQPFNQQENDYWSGAIGVELAPKVGTYHLSAKLELKDGTAESSRLAVLAGDLALNRSVALLARQDYATRRWGGGLALDQSRRNASLFGLALRPAGSESVNGLFQLRWLDDANPIGGGVLGRMGHERRLLASAELIWTPTARLELGGRCAVRATRSLQGDSLPGLESRALFCGGRYDVSLTRYLVLRGEGRVLREQIGGLQRWDVAPSILFRTPVGIELGLGHRIGNLQDPDFANGSNSGWFFTFGLRITEASFTNAADYWRSRGSF